MYTFLMSHDHPYTIPGCALGHHYKVVQWFSLICSVPTEVSLEVSVQITKGPPLAPCGSQENTLLYPLIPNQADPKRVHSIYTTDWYAKLGSTTYCTGPYIYRLIVVLFSWVVTP
jgi:hypothetical protein